MEDETDVSEDVQIDASFLLEWIEERKAESSDKPNNLATIVERLTLEQVKTFVLELVARHHKDSRLEAFTLPNFKEQEE